MPAVQCQVVTASKEFPPRVRFSEDSYCSLSVRVHKRAELGPFYSNDDLQKFCGTPYSGRRMQILQNVDTGRKVQFIG